MVYLSSGHNKLTDKAASASVYVYGQLSKNQYATIVTSRIVDYCVGQKKKKKQLTLDVFIQNAATVLVDVHSDSNKTKIKPSE